MWPDVKMLCKKCGTFKISIWIIKCGECKEKYCTKCMQRLNGICYCEKCLVLIRRPPDINEVMQLKSKDIQEYLNRHGVATYGIVEKRELVILFCNKAVPVKNTKTSTVLNKIVNNIETVLNLPERISNNIVIEGERAEPPQSQPQPPGFASSSTTGPPSSSNNLPGTGTESVPSSSAHTESPSFTTRQPQEEAQEPKVSTAESSPRIVMKAPQLSEIETVEKLNDLSAKELKMLLLYYRVDYKGCVEKRDLLEKATTLWLDNHIKQRQFEELPDNNDDLCKLCMDAPLDCVLLECGHMATCITCGKQLAECPICRQYVSRIVRTFKA